MEDKDFMREEVRFDDALSEFIKSCNEFEIDVADRLVNLLSDYGIEL